MSGFQHWAPAQLALVPWEYFFKGLRLKFDNSFWKGHKNSNDLQRYFCSSKTKSYCSWTMQGTYFLKIFTHTAIANISRARAIFVRATPWPSRFQIFGLCLACHYVRVVMWTLYDQKMKWDKSLVHIRLRSWPQRPQECPMGPKFLSQNFSHIIKIWCYFMHFSH